MVRMCLQAGTVVVGVKAGRGAYVCDNAACVQGLAKGDRLARALRARLTEEQLRTIQNHGIIKSSKRAGNDD